jgi:glycosyltransferase involved in cell wall biosynthesis
MSVYHALTGAGIRSLWRDANAVIANSKGLAGLARRHDPTCGVSVIPAGADVAGITPKDDYSVRGEVTLLFVGRLVRQKGLDVLIAALAKISLAVKWRLVLVGDGPEWPALAGEASRLGIADRLELRGWVAKEKLPEVYRSGDIFLLPSRDEGMPNALLEAMAAGLPVIATNVNGTAEVVIDGETGLLVEPENVEALTAALERLVTSERKRADFGTAGRARVARAFGWDTVAKAWSGVIEQAIAEGPRR